tara:strand:+ start:1570 stop:1806 length:237 start_codon:yes stop_codon:yes gene_type:complete
VPAETQSGSLLRLKGKGIKSVKNNQLGDIICHIVVETPVKLNKKQKIMLEDFHDSIQENQQQHPKTRSFFEKIKRMMQ